MKLNTSLIHCVERMALYMALSTAWLCCPTSGIAQQPVLAEVPASISGIVLQPDGKPAADAPVMLYWHKPFAKTKTTKDGAFTLKVDIDRIKTEVGEEWPRMAIASISDSSGPGWQILGRVTDPTTVELQLVVDVPVTGKILDQQGRPVEGAKVTIQNLHRAKDENLDGFLKASRDQPTRTWLYERDSMLYLSPEAVLKLQGIKDQRRPYAVTDADGKYSLSGFGKNRSLFATIEGPGITRESVYIVTRPEIDSRWNRGSLSRETKMELESGSPMRSVYPANFHHLAAPALTIRGRLTDAKTGVPVQGMRLSARMTGHLTPGIATSDKDGRYEIIGLPTEGEMRLSVLNPGNQPYLDAEIKREVKATAAVGEIDFKLDRGVSVTGVVTDANTNQPVAGNIGYFSWRENEHIDRLSHPYNTFNAQGTDKEGRYEIIVPPGPGVLAFQARNRSHYDSAESSGFGFTTSQGGMFPSGNRGYVRPSEFNFLKRIEPTLSTSRLEVDITLGRGPVLSVSARKSDGGAFNELNIRGSQKLALKTVRGGKFEIGGMDVGDKRNVFIRDRQLEFAGVFDLQRTEESDTIELVVPRTGSVSGRIADTNGRPLSRWTVTALSEGVIKAVTENKGMRPDGLYEFDDTLTDADGYFRLKGLPPGVQIEIATAERVEGRNPDIKRVKELTLRPGQQLDLGQLKVE
ncbi:carboxypeptidase-like regulatory domain-containing protein [Novipirellula rosea]|uniref:Nickel uptake substrate-specific transmembrane region n=1 Tax=Novipirellula rosea TaxID=1031540 RepID=A0ABP8MQ09_9BACT